MSHTENFPRKAFETACHAMGVLEQNREYLQFHLRTPMRKRSRRWRICSGAPPGWNGP